MPIRTEDEHRAALARLDQERVIMRSRSFTDEEQRDFDSLTSDIAAYEAARSPGSGSAPPAAPPRPSPPILPSQPAPAASACPPTLLADDMRARLNPTASMRRELARAGLASSAPLLSASRQGWRGVVDQQNLRTANPHAAKPPGADVLRCGGAADMRASMEREIRRAGLTPNR